MSTKRVTVMIDEETDRKLRKVQARRISDENRSVSYSEVLNDTLKRGL